MPSRVTEVELLRESLIALRAENRDMRVRLQGAERIALTEKAVQERILQLADAERERPRAPEWLVPRSPPIHGPGVPTLFASDWHWGEVVTRAQIGGVNSFNLKIARERVKRLAANTIDLLKNHMVCPEYPGLVLALGGDMVTGDIHEELTATNEMEIMPVVLDLLDHVEGLIVTLKAAFGRLFIPCVTGNHGRTTKKIRFKGRAFTNYDWLVYQFLRRRFRDDPDIVFLVPSGMDAYYRIYNHRYLLNHGDLLGGGGDGIIGALGPILRGDTKKRARNGQINMAYDTMLVGHWHQYLPLGRVIVNGALKGYDEFASGLSLPFEEPKQALFLTHPDRGITFHCPVFLEPKRKQVARDWVAFTDADAPVKEAV